VLVARLTPLKGLERTVRLAKGLGVPLTVIGDGPARTRLSATSSVRFLGRLPRAQALAHLASARAAVLLPRVDEDGTGAEGLGLCLLEAAARATPVIGCRVGGVPEAVGPGLVLDDPDHPDLDQVARFLDDPEAGARARAWVSHHHGPAHTLAILREAAS
jgi:glycosyltransferase involved in cell wall biosynthesis